jgi:signal transduction histidine kinase/CheY-like chemotaxis protein
MDPNPSTERRELDAGLCCAPGTPFLDWFVQHAASELGVDWAIVWERCGTSWERSRLVAGSHRGSSPVPPGREVALAGAPCAEVHSHGTFVCESGARARFPSCAPLAELGAESCGGVAFRDGAGRPLGHLMILDGKPCPDPGRWLALLSRFQARIAGEMQQRHTLRELEEMAAATRGAGEETLANLARGLARALHADTAFVCELLPDRHDRVRSLAISVDGNAQPVGEVDLAGTPCEIAHRDGAHFVADGVQLKYPTWAPLRTLSSRAYLGFRLDARDATHLGHFGVLSREPLSPEIRQLPIVRLYVDRAAAELERRRGEAQRLSAERRLADSRRRESLGTLAGGLAHDLNNHLMTILGHVSLQREEGTGGAPDATTPIELATRRAAAVVQKMLACAGTDVARPEPVAIGPLATACLRDHPAIELQVDPDLPEVAGDANRLRQLLEALTQNALEAIAVRGGTVRVRARRVELDAAARRSLLCGTTLTDGEHVLIDVVDDGIGMDAATLSRACEPFFSTKGDGRGLGLALALGIARAHGGDVSLRSEPALGTTVRVSLPALARTEAGPASKARATAVTTPGKPTPVIANRGRLLLVDDESTVRSAVQRMLERLGWSVRAASDGISALAALKTEPSLLGALLDLTMPQMSGEELFREIQVRRPGLPVVMMSGYPAPDAMQRFRGAGVAGFLQKPFDLADLRRIVDETFATEPAREAD